MRFLFIGSRFTLHASSPRSVALTQLRFTSLTVTSSWRDLHPQVGAHAGRTMQMPRKGGASQDWRRDPESNRTRRICNPLHNRFAIAPKGIQKKEAKLPFDAAAGLVTGCEFWSGKSDLH